MADAFSPRRSSPLSVALLTVALALPMASRADKAAKSGDEKAALDDAGKKRAALALYRRSLDALRQSNPGDAIGLLQRCLKQDPEQCLCYRGLATAHPRPAAAGFIQAYVDQCPDAADAEAFREALSREPPRTPKGLPPCVESLRPATALPHRAGESIRYHVEVSGLSVGVVDFKIERNGLFGVTPATEYRATFRLDSVVASFVSLEGRAASVVPRSDYVPLHAMSKLHSRGREREERLELDHGGRWVHALRTLDGKERRLQRRYPIAVVDFLTAFYGMRALARDAAGCAVFYGSGRAHTVWLEPDGQEHVRTPVGLRNADRYRVRYGVEGTGQIVTGQVWLDPGASRLPYQMVLEGKRTLKANIHLYEAGEP